MTSVMPIKPIKSMSGFSPCRVPPVPRIWGPGRGEQQIQVVANHRSVRLRVPHPDRVFAFAVRVRWHKPSDQAFQETVPFPTSFPFWPLPRSSRANSFRCALKSRPQSPTYPLHLPANPKPKEQPMFEILVFIALIALVLGPAFVSSFLSSRTMDLHR